MPSPGSSIRKATFTPLMSREVYGEAIANPKKIIEPHK
jgi:hypothetical protein